ncbi:MAG: Hpt domain-containing protein [Lachnospiraceae bacterium]|nr:Hpt domain-containing protein [Lachnospiraceae bacterium]
MTTRECYELMGADYENVLERLMTEKLVRKFLYKFADAGDMEELKTSLAAGDYSTAFRMSHNLKGVCANLGITRLCASSSELCEELRDGNYTDKVEPLFAAVTADYEETIAAIKELQAQESQQ